MPSDYANDLMARVGLDTTEWKKGITDLNAGIKHIETGFQATAALMDDWGNSSEGLKKRIETLNDKLALQKQKLDILKKAYDEEVAANGEGSKAAEELGKKMYAAKNEIERTKASIEKYSKAEDEATKKTKALITKLEESGKKFTDVGDKISSVGNKMTIGITAPVIAAGTAIYKYSSDLTEAENKTESIFGYMSDSVKEWAQNSLDAFGMAKSTAYDAVSLYGDMATSMGLGKSAAADMSMSLVELSADLSSFRNVSLEQSQNALKGIFTGETESLKNLGIVMTETQLKAYAMSQGFEKNYEDMTQAEKVQLRYQYVLESSANALGDYSKTSGEAAGQVKKLPEALKELASSFRDNVEPSITPIITTINGAIVAFGKMGDDAKKTTVNIALFAAAIGPLVTATGKTVSIIGKAKTAIASYRSWLLKKTKATVEDTAAEATHSKALDKTASSASGAAKNTKGIGTAAKSAMPYLTAVAASLVTIGAIGSYFVNKFEGDLEEKYEKLKETAEESYQAESKLIQSNLDETQKAYDDAVEAAKKSYKSRIKAAEDYVKIEEASIEKERKLYEKAYEERISLIEKEREARKQKVDEDAAAENALLQARIDALNAESEAEEVAANEKTQKDKLAELQAAINSATTYAEKLEAEKAYNDYILEIEKEKAQKERDLEIQRLNEQINSNNARADDLKNTIDDEYDSQVKAADDEYALLEQSLDKRSETLKTHIDSVTQNATNILNKATDNAKTKYEEDTKNFNDQLDEKRKSYEEYLDDLEKQREKEEESLSWIEKVYKGGQDLRDWFEEHRILDIGGWLTEKIHGIPRNASGTDYWRGGPTWVNEEGGEILNLPRGTQIIPHDVSMEMARAAVTNNNSTTNNSTTNNSYNYGAQQQVNVFKVGEKTLATAIEPAVSVRMSNNIYGRRRSGGGG